MPLNHVALTVRDRERSARFYGRHFALTARVHDDEHLLILGSPDGSLLALTEGPVPAAALSSTNHFGFQARDAQEVRHARERLRRERVTETEWQDDHGFVRVQVADPDGYRVEVFAIASAPAPRPPRSRWTSFVADAARTRPACSTSRATMPTGCGSSTTGARCSCTSAVRTAEAGLCSRSIARAGARHSRRASARSTPRRPPTRSCTRAADPR